MFMLDKVMPNGAQTRYHKAVRFEVSADGTHATVNSYHSEEMQMISWQDIYVIPPLIRVESLANVEYLLTYTNAPFEGGTIVPDDTATLDSQKARKKAELQLRKIQAENSGCETPKGRVQTDPDSRTKILGLFMMASTAKADGVAFSQKFTMEDNTNLDHNADEMIALGLAVGQYISDIHAYSLTLKSAIEAAADSTALDAVDINTGWPGEEPQQGEQEEGTENGSDG